MSDVVAERQRQAGQKIGPRLSPVDYDAWERGYMPPSEHVLIDALAYRGARVVMGSDYGEGKGAVWLVMRDKRPARKYVKRLMEMLLDVLDDDDEAAPHTPEAASGENENHQPGQVLSSSQPEGGSDGEHPIEANTGSVM